MKIWHLKNNMSKIILFKIQYWDSNQECLILNLTDLIFLLRRLYASQHVISGLWPRKEFKCRILLLFLKRVYADTSHRGRRDLNTWHIVKETSLVCQVSQSPGTKKITCLWTYLFSWSVYTVRGRYQILQNLIKANYGVNRKFSELNWSVQGFNAVSTLRNWTLLIWIFFWNSKENCFETFNFKTSMELQGRLQLKVKKEVSYSKRFRQAWKYLLKPKEQMYTMT